MARTMLLVACVVIVVGVLGLVLVLIALVDPTLIRMERIYGLRHK